jgi:hypothetical protein
MATIQQRLLAVSASVIGLALAGCATTDNGPTPSAADSAKLVKSDKEATTGSRIARPTSERMIRSTVQDKADEPVRSIGNVVGNRSN